MSNKIKALVLGALTVLAINVGAGSAAAVPAEFSSAAYPATLTGTPTKEHAFMSKAGWVKCATGNFGGTLTAKSETLLTGVSYANCTFEGGGAATVNPTGCTYLQRAGGSVGTGESVGSLTVECPLGKTITATVMATGCEIRLWWPAGEVGLNPYTNTATGFKMGVSVEFNYTLNNKCKVPAGNYTEGILTGEYGVVGNNGLIGIVP
jgi:hypothetical protein